MLCSLYLVLVLLYSVPSSLYLVQTLFGVFFIITGANAIILGALFLIFGAKAIIFGTSLFGAYFIIFGTYFIIFGAFFDMIVTSLFKGQDKCSGQIYFGKGVNLWREICYLPFVDHPRKFNTETAIIFGFTSVLSIFHCRRLLFRDVNVCDL